MSIGGKSRNYARFGFCSALALIGAGVWTTPSFADDTQIDEVIVTAQRREQNLQEVPISVTTLKGENLTALFDSGQDIRALAGKVPSLYAESSNGRIAPRFYIRGLGNSDFDLAASQPVSIIMDDVVMENTVLKSFPIFDQADVEIDRGPQGTLFGRNTTAGIIKFTSKAPSFDWSAYGSVSYGTYGTFNAEGAVGGPIVPGKLAFRASILSQDRSDYIDNYDGVTASNNYTGGYRERAGRLQLLFTPTDNLSVLLNFHGRSINGTAAIFRANIFDKGSNKLNSNYDPDQTYFNDGGGNPQKYNGYGTSAKIEYKMDGLTLTSITGFDTTQGSSRGDIDGGNTVFGPGFIPFQSDTTDGLDHLAQFTQELHLASNSTGPLLWQVGGYYFNSDFRITTVGDGFPPPTPVRHENDAYALFGQLSYKITNAFSLTGGLRYTRDNKKLTSDGFGGFGPYIEQSLSADNISWDVSTDYKLTEDVNLYARVATGFRAPSIQGRDIAFGNPPSTARAETITSFEVGAKTELFDKRVRLNGDIFYYTVNNMQLSAIGGGGNFVKLVNADRGEAFGFELDSEAKITPHFVVTAGLSYTNTKIKDKNLSTLPCGATNGPPAFGPSCTVTDALTGLNGNEAVLDGNPFPQAPELIATLTARYGIPVGVDGEVFLYTDWSYQGYTNFFLYQSKEFYSEGNIEGGLRLGYTGSNGLYEVAFYARNITNAENVQGAIDFNNFTGFVSDPRVIGIQLSTHYN